MTGPLIPVAGEADMPSIDEDFQMQALDSEPVAILPIRSRLKSPLLRF